MATATMALMLAGQEGPVPVVQVFVTVDRGPDGMICCHAAYKTWCSRRWQQQLAQVNGRLKSA